MKKKIVTLCILLSGLSHVYAERVKLMIENQSNSSAIEVPIHVDFDQSNRSLRIDFKKSIDCTVIVSGVDGIVYQQSISVKNYQSVRLDLKQYEEGDYEIVFYDTEGNVIDGSFYLNDNFKIYTHY